ncbi:hypothetical protein R3O67_30985 [Bacillus cereus]
MDIPFKVLVANYTFLVEGTVLIVPHQKKPHLLMQLYVYIFHLTGIDLDAINC